MMPAVLLLVDVSLGDERQARAALRYAGGHELSIVALAGHDQAAALAAVRAGTAAAVLAALEPPGGVLADLEAALRACGGRMVFARVSATARALLNTEAALVGTALRNSGGDVELVARLLGLPLERVRALAGDLTRRPQLTTRPVLAHQARTQRS